jgi:formate dehydrogenase subunit gamma
MKLAPHRVRAALALWALALTLGVAAPALAQHGRDVPPAPLSGSPNASNPTANAVSEDALLQRLQKLEGRVTIPDGKAAILQQPQGREYRGFREEILPWLGGLAILGMVVLLAAFYFTKGRIRLDHSEESGRKILRFNAFERFTHWLTGDLLHRARRLRPQLHLRQAAPHAADRPGRLRGLVAIRQVRPQLPVLAVHAGPPVHAGGLDQDNIPDRTDIRWIREGGGFIGDGHPPARRFNAGRRSCSGP